MSDGLSDIRKAVLEEKITGLEGSQG